LHAAVVASAVEARVRALVVRDAAYPHLLHTGLEPLLPRIARAADARAQQVGLVIAVRLEAHVLGGQVIVASVVPAQVKSRTTIGRRTTRTCMVANAAKVYGSFCTCRRPVMRSRYVSRHFGADEAMKSERPPPCQHPPVVCCPVPNIWSSDAQLALPIHAFPNISNVRPDPIATSSIRRDCRNPLPKAFRRSPPQRAPSCAYVVPAQVKSRAATIGRTTRMCMVADRASL